MVRTHMIGCARVIERWCKAYLGEGALGENTEMTGQQDDGRLFDEMAKRDGWFDRLAGCCLRDGLVHAATTQRPTATAAIDCIRHSHQQASFATGTVANDDELLAVFAHCCC